LILAKEKAETFVPFGFIFKGGAAGFSISFGGETIALFFTANAFTAVSILF
jgi:hypothetical protein